MDNYNYPTYQQQRPMYQPQQRQDGVIVRMAYSREEAVATPGDFFKITVILGLNHGTVYIKKWNGEKGEMSFDAFKYAPDAAKAPEYVTVENFDAFKNAVAQALNQMRGGEQSE